MDDITKFMGVTCAVIVIALTTACTVSVSSAKNMIRQYELAEERVKSGWACYLEGKEVDADTIDLSEFKVTFNEDKKYVILTERESRDSHATVFPVIPAL